MELATRSYWQARLWALALAIFSHGLALAAPDKALLKSQEGAAAVLRNRFDLAVAAYDEALKEPGLPAGQLASIYSDRGVAKWRLKQYDGALADFSKAISLYPEFANAYNNRGALLFEQNKIEEAYKDFDRAVALSRGFAAAYNNRGNANERLNRLQAAEEDFRKAIELMPSSAAPYNGKGKVASLLGRDFAALRYLNRAVALNAQYTPAYRNRARIQMQLERYDDAIKDYEKLIALFPEEAELYVRRGQSYARTKRGVHAFRDFSKALELNPENAEALAGRAGQHIERKRADLALEDANEAIARNGRLAEAYYWRGQAHRMQNQLTEAEQAFKQAIEIEPANSDFWRALGDIHEAQGQHEAAVADFRKALELNPFSREAREAYTNVSGETAETVVRPIGGPVGGWDLYRTPTGRFVAYNELYPKIPLTLEMMGEGEGELLEWTPLKDGLGGIGLLRYAAGRVGGKPYENVAIIDVSRNQIVSIEPYVMGDGKAKWDWTANAVTVSDPEGVISFYELRKPKPVVASESNEGDPFGLGRRRGRRRSGDGGLFDWLFD